MSKSIANPVIERPGLKSNNINRYLIFSNFKEIHGICFILVLSVSKVCIYVYKYVYI